MGSRTRWTRRAIVRLVVAVTAIPLLGAFTPADAGTAGRAPASSRPAASRLAVPSPTVTGPVTGGKGAPVLVSTLFPLASVGYTQSEFFLSGTARSFTSARALGSDGRWQVTPASTAPYTTRIVVYRPANRARFNGTVIVEWLNVTIGADSAPDWIVAHNEMIRDGFAWVGVSAQLIGLNATKAADPVRYATLSHPGDSYSYDMYSQVGSAIRHSAATILSGLRPRAVLAEGESQSAFRLTTYIDAIQPLAHVYDGFLVHSRAGAGAALSQAPQADVPSPPVVFIRPDLDVPVLTVQTETDVLVLGYLAARQPDTARFRLWEMAGTTHADDYLVNLGLGDNGNGTVGAHALSNMLHPPSGAVGLGQTCASPINTGEMHYVMDTAEYALNRWVTRRVPPARAPRLQVNTSGATPAFVVDADGNVRGGVRTPAVDVPIATLSGVGQTGPALCFLLGRTIPFDAAKLAARYPTHQRFVARWAADAVFLVVTGFIRPADAAELISAAASSTVGG